MARVDPEVLASSELVCVFIATTLAEARRAEELLTLQGVDYVVSVERFGTTLFGSARHGAAFHVVEGQAVYCGSKLIEAGLGLGVLIDDSTEVE